MIKKEEEKEEKEGKKWKNSQRRGSRIFYWLSIWAHNIEYVLYCWDESMKNSKNTYTNTYAHNKQTLQ